jgi:hypothetical protein
LDSAISWAASSAAETFQRAAERSRGARYRVGTNDGSAVAAPSPSPPLAPTALPTCEQGGGPRVNP